MENQARSIPLYDQQEAAVRAGRGGWKEVETHRLLAAVKEASEAGKPLRTVFEALSADLGRKPNSIRNYYYACVRAHPEAAPRTPAFTAFTPEETRELLRQVLMAQGRGMSVRACVMQLAEGSHSRMLRYQNKYRTILRNRPELIAEVCEELRREGLPCPEAAPHITPHRIDHADAAFCDPDDAAAARLMAQPCVHHMLEGLKELLRRAARAEAAIDPNAELQRTIDRQQVRFDLQRIAWEKDYDECAGHLMSMADALRSLLSPAGDPSDRAVGEAAAHAALAQAESYLASRQACLQ